METSFERNQLLKEVLKNEEVQKVVRTHNISIDELDNSLNTVLAYTLKSKKCLNCKGLESCKQSSLGYAPSLDYDGIRLDVNFIPCGYLQEVEYANTKIKNLKLLSCNIKNFDFNDIYINSKRQEVLKKIKECYSNYEKGLDTKGLYIHGRYGCGKTYLLAYLAQQFAANNHKVIFAYYPDLVRSFKSAITEGSLETKIDELKNIEILVLDDFGGETTTSFIRDEVLSAILQDRMINNRLTFMSSNLNETMLMEHLSESKNKIDEIRASRVHERIRSLMEFIELDDQNYRK